MSYLKALALLTRRSIVDVILVNDVICLLWSAKHQYHTMYRACTFVYVDAQIRGDCNIKIKIRFLSTTLCSERVHFSTSIHGFEGTEISKLRKVLAYSLSRFFFL